MNTEKKKHDDGDKKIVELHIAGHHVTLSFAEEPDTTLIDSYIRQNAAGYRTG